MFTIFDSNRINSNDLDTEIEIQYLKLKKITKYIYLTLVVRNPFLLGNKHTTYNITIGI